MNVTDTLKFSAFADREIPIEFLRPLIKRFDLAEHSPIFR